VSANRTATGERRDERWYLVDSDADPVRRNQYRTTSNHQLDGRPLLLRGGALNGRHWTAKVAVGQRVFCGEGRWSPEGLYLVTAEDVVDDDGIRRSVAVPAFA
jgi:hypothetical protein